MGRLDPDAANSDLRAAMAQLSTQIQFTRAVPAEVFRAVSDMAAAEAGATLWVAAGIGAVAALVPGAAATAAERAVQPDRPTDMGPAVLRAHTLLVSAEHGQARAARAQTPA